MKNKHRIFRDDFKDRIVCNRLTFRFLDLHQCIGVIQWNEKHATALKYFISIGCVLLHLCNALFLQKLMRKIPITFILFLRQIIREFAFNTFEINNIKNLFLLDGKEQNFFFFVNKLLKWKIIFNIILKLNYFIKLIWNSRCIIEEVNRLLFSSYQAFIAKLPCFIIYHY